jgi:hypothetical protein
MLLADTILRNTKTIEQIADEIGIKASSLYRYGNPSDAGSDIPLKRLVPLMNSTKNYSVLKHLAKICGFIMIKVPRVAISKGDDIDLVSDYQESTNNAVRFLSKFLKNPTQESYEAADHALQEVMERSASAQKYVDKSYKGQLEMEL